ncbi:hypothetical protein [Plastoroseomonas arctica]|uniref:Uncharacterized protein n=1 Tax=Plastoroseomonas arctica TaxID=1509237 RepID=A0AAF1JZ53_9PROT|nr:hypothetical protein [Plastoroseomonas arctica]MBR0654219.1 hypothetical protein [Plastoroseomonas arctica]
MRGVVFAILLGLAAPALAQGKPEALPPAGAAPAPAPSGPRCAPPLANGCLGMQSSCQMACPGIWSTNPSAPAFTPTDRAGCMQRCLMQYNRCMTQYGCY